MKKIFLFAVIIITATGIFISCKKEHSCEGCKGNKPPIAVAGPDQVITLPTDSISLDGSASNDPDGKINVWLWKKISGPASFAIANSSVARTKAKNLVAGAYKFELTVTDNKGASARDTMMVTVDATQPSNHLPLANAGADQTITLPTNSVTLDGSSSTDPDNNITAYEWTKISGPSSFSITSANSAQTLVNNLVQGVYQFGLKVTDADGLVDRDTIQVIVNAAVQETNRDIYVAGAIKVGNNNVATYWKNGVAVSLTDGTNNASASCIAVAGNNVCVSGNEFNGSNYVAKYWKNGQALSLTDGTKTAYAHSITIAGNDVYVAGEEWDGNAYYIYYINDRGQVDSSLNYHTVAKYWKNGQEISLTDGKENAFATSIAVVGSDVYVTGGENDGSSNSGAIGYIAKYWKNGQPVTLSGGTYTTSIAIAGSDIFVAGQKYNGSNMVAIYWKNGVAIPLTDGMYEGQTSSISVAGNDVYVAGTEWTLNTAFAKYWKNGQAVTLSNVYSVANSITVVGNDVYIAGNDDIVGSPQKSIATFWKNGVAVRLTNAEKISGANSIFVVQR